MEILVIAALFALAAKSAVVDALYAVRGRPSPRHEAAKARYAAKAAKASAAAAKAGVSAPRRTRSKGPARQYGSELWADAWTDLSARHARKRDERQAAPSQADRPRGAAWVFFSGLAQDGRRKARREWDAAFVRADEARRAKSTRLRPDTDVVPGEVVPNEDGPTVPDPVDLAAEPTTSPAADPTPSGDEPSSPDGSTADASDVTGASDLTSNNPTPSGSPASAPDTTGNPNTAPTERNTAMSNIEVSGLQSAITYAAGTADGAEQAAVSIEQTIAALQSNDVDGPAIAALVQAQEQFGSAAASLREAERELVGHIAVKDAYDGTGGNAGSKEFVTAE